MGFKSDIKEKTKILATADNVFLEAIQSLEKSFFSAVLKLLRKFDTTGGALSKGSKSSTKLLSGLQNELFEIFEKSTYKSKVRAYLKNFDRIEALTLSSVGEINNKDLSKLDVNVEKKLAIKGVANRLTKAESIQTFLVQPIVDVLYRGIKNGMQTDDLENELRGVIKSKEGSSSVMLRYVRTIATTALNQYEGSLNLAIKNELGFNARRYVGGLMKTSRPQCIRWVNKGIITDEELPAEVEWANRNGKGYGSGLVLTVDNFDSLVGGWNCIHYSIPFKLEDKSARKKIDEIK